MKILKKKYLGIFEVYVLFFSCMLTGYLSYLFIVNNI